MQILIADDHPIVKRGIKDVILDECSLMYELPVSVPDDTVLAYVS
jgi:hypothetical protein